jgi:threonine/homoserine/homoserine lactone efflux protein
MPLELLLAQVVFASVMAFTPGPNNVLLAASGVNFGFMRTMPHMLGVTIGLDVLLIAGAIGVGLLFTAVPQLQLVLKVAGAAVHLHGGGGLPVDQSEGADRGDRWRRPLCPSRI